MINAIKFNAKRSRAPWPYLILGKVYGSRGYKISCETRGRVLHERKTFQKRVKVQRSCRILSFANIGCINPDANIVIELNLGCLVRFVRAITSRREIFRYPPREQNGAVFWQGFQSTSISLFLSFQPNIYPFEMQLDYRLGSSISFSSTRLFIHFSFKLNKKKSIEKFRFIEYKSTIINY